MQEKVDGELRFPKQDELRQRHFQYLRKFSHFHWDQ